MARVRRTIRRSQTLSPFGVGAIYDVLGESFAAADTSRWPGTSETITMDRLAASLPGVQDFRALPPAPEERYKTFGAGMPFQRFPRWLFCQQCRRMESWNRAREAELKGDAPRCENCRNRPVLVPMRFVAVCADGHLADVDWPRWAHSRQTSAGTCRSRNLRFDSNPSRGSGLASLSVTCQSCNSSQDLGQIASKDALARVGLSCDGLQPWQHPDRREECSRIPQVVQRGASNVHFSEIRSALDIPPWSDYDPDAEETTALRTDPNFHALENQVADPGRQRSPLVAMLAEDLSDTHGFDSDVIIGLAVKRATGAAPQPRQFDEADLVDQEWEAFRQPTGAGHPLNRFVTRPVELDVDGHPDLAELSSLVGGVVVADKLREVRAFTGFSRLEPGGRVIPPDLTGSLPWLPGLEIYGEGVFLTLSEDRLRSWEQRPEVRERAGLIEANRADSYLAGVLRTPATPRFVALHTLAHLLIRQLTFECGYSSASLRERLYARTSDDRPMAGLLVYTASGDSEGTLGGLARQGEPPRLANTLMAALSRATWCSTDPICIESPGQGLGALNRGACHSCALAAETSCVHLNSLLDRALVVGTPESPDLGLFSSVVDATIAVA